MDIYIISNEKTAEEDGIFEKLKSFYGPNVEKCFRDWINSSEYSKGEFKLTSNGVLEDLEISALDYKLMTEYVKVFSESRGLDAMVFYSANMVSNSAFSSKFLEENLSKIVTTKNNVVFLGKGKRFLGAVNRGEDIDYDYFENLYESENYRIEPYHLETTGVENVEPIKDEENKVRYTLNFLVRAHYKDTTIKVPLKLDGKGKLEDNCIELLMFKNIRFDSDLPEELEKILSDYDSHDIEEFFKDVHMLLCDEEYVLSYLD